MKKLYLFLFLILIFAACKKQPAGTPTPPVVSGTGLPGTWELRSTSGTIAGGTDNYPSGNGNIFVFTNTTYQHYSAGSITDQGTYTLTQQMSYLYNKMENTIVFNNVTGAPVILITQSGNDLTLALDADDGGESTYLRIK